MTIALFLLSKIELLNDIKPGLCLKCCHTSLVLRGEGLKMPGVLQGLHLVADSPAEQTDKVQAMQLELQTAVQVQKTLSIRYSPPARTYRQECKK